MPSGERHGNWGHTVKNEQPASSLFPASYGPLNSIRMFTARRRFDEQVTKLPQHVVLEGTEPS